MLKKQKEQKNKEKIKSGKAEESRIIDMSQKALEDLVDIKILVAHRSTSTTGYSYTRNSKIISKIEKLLKKRSAA